MRAKNTAKTAAQRLISALQGQKGVRNRKKVAKPLGFLFLERIDRRNRANPQNRRGKPPKKLAPQWRRQMRRCRFLFNRRADCRRRNRLIPQIPNTADGFQVLRKLRAELGTHTSNMDVDGSRATKIVKPPNATKQSVTRIRTSRMRYEECQQRIFQLGEIDRLAVYGNLIRCQVDGHAINRDKIVCRAFISRPQ